MTVFDDATKTILEDTHQSVKDRFPEVRRLEEMEEIESISPTKATIGDTRVHLSYVAVAPKLFPAVRQRLIDAGVATRNNMIGTRLTNEGMPDETYAVSMGYHGSRLIVHVDFKK